MIKDIGSAFRALSSFDLRSLSENRLVKMGLVGAVGFLIQSLFFEIVGIQLDLLSPPSAALFGAEIAIVANFFLNNRFTFGDQSIPFSWGMVPKFLKFNAAVVLSLATQWLMVFIGERVGGESDWMLRLFNILGVIIGFTMNYVSYTKIIWRNSNSEIAGGETTEPQKSFISK